MKTLLLIRHTKSSRENPKLDDFDRPLKQDRKKDASAVAQKTLKNGVVPELVICSPARRAIDTARLLSEEWNYDIRDVQMERSLYNTTGAEIMAHLMTLDTKLNVVAIVGHNPAVTEFINQYTNEKIVNVPTTGCLQVDWDIKKWSEAGKKKGDVSMVILPKKIR